MSQPNDGYKHDEGLRARIQAFSPDEPGIVFPFSARLARENGWTRAFAERVVEEYRRFLYLAMTAGHTVTPSVEVDQAWHQHLTYTRSYWDELCGKVLGRPLHHEPTKGGSAEGNRFVDLYARTLDSYRAAFGQEPPRDIWPTAEERFAAEARIIQVSEATHWIIRKPRLPRRMGRVAAVLGTLMLAAACTGDISPRDWATVAVVVAVLVVIVISEVNGSSKGYYNNGGRSSGGCGGGGSFSGGDCGDGGGGCGGGCGGCG
ncbi:MAG TPA: hypothetical protein VEQ60_04515 [Longimicrobium sp.]|nr:hypothetical protein [Longimicrobium sp.]